MRTVRMPCWPTATARLNARVVFPTPPLGANSVIIRAVPNWSIVAAAWWTCWSRVTSS
jgi:hypothetical protein